MCIDDSGDWLGNYPWFATYNTLQASVPRMDGAWRYARNGVIGICASCVSDVTSNSLRVIKTVKQVSGNAGVRTSPSTTHIKYK